MFIVYNTLSTVVKQRAVVNKIAQKGDALCVFEIKIVAYLCRELGIYFNGSDTYSTVDLPLRAILKEL